MSKSDLTTYALAVLERVERKNPDKKYRFRMKTDIFRFLAEPNFLAHQDTKDFSYMGLPVMLDDNIPEEQIDKNMFTSEVLIEEIS